MTLKIGSYTIESKQGKKALENEGIKSDADLKKIDTNSDNKISNQELEDAQIEVDFDDDELDTDEADDSEETDDAEEADESEKTAASSSGMSEIEALEESIAALEETLFNLLNQLNTSADMDQMDSVLSTISTTQSTLSSERASLIKLMTGGTTSTNGTTAANGTSTNSTGDLDTSSAANFALSLTNNGSSSVEAGEMKSKMTAAGCQFDDGAWCGDFCYYVLKETYGQDGSPGDYLNTCSNPAYVPAIRSWAEEKGVLSSDSSQVQPGDLILYGNNHVGMVVKVNSDGTVDTVEGNTSNDQTGAYDSPSGDGWCSHHSGKSGDYVLLHKLK